MAEILKCPNCNAQIHVVSGRNVLKCEYCDTEVIIDNNIQVTSAPSNNNVNSQNHLCEGDLFRKVNYVNPEDYPEEMKKWKKKCYKTMIVQAVLSVLSVLSAFIINTYEAGLVEGTITLIMIFAPLLYGTFASLLLSNKKPCLPDVQITDIRKYTACNSRNNPIFLCGAFVTMIIMLIIPILAE
ncbi:MAG: hypothetical protein K2J08_06720 [Ruminococcus sp.]|nr:hypothetical protein [Ruminococcus sp.]